MSETPSKRDVLILAEIIAASIAEKVGDLMQRHRCLPAHAGMVCM